MYNPSQLVSVMMYFEEGVTIKHSYHNKENIINETLLLLRLNILNQMEWGDAVREGTVI